MSLRVSIAVTVAGFVTAGVALWWLFNGETMP